VVVDERRVALRIARRAWRLRALVGAREPVLLVVEVLALVAGAAVVDGGEDVVGGADVAEVGILGDVAEAVIREGLRGLLARRRLALEEQAVALDELRVDLAVVLVSGEGLS
jgi:hypothetical protein